MKKIIVSAVGLMLGGTLLATSAYAAVENQFGGYWRTRVGFFDNMAADPGASTYVVDTRTRIYYTAKFSDNLKFVNKFEWNSYWGDGVGGDIGTDGMGIFRIKNSYVDAQFGTVNVKVGAHALAYSRGLIFDDDFMGATVSADFGAVTPKLVWAHTMDQDWGGQDYDQDFIYAGVEIKAGDMVTVTPAVTFFNGSAEVVDVEEDLVTGIGQPLTTTVTGQESVGGESYVYVGVDVDVKLDPVTAWGTFIYQTGEVNDTVDINAFAFAAGADANFVHGAFYYASGDDGTDPTETEAFTPVSEYVVTAEIMGAGLLDGYRGPANAGWGISNFMLANVGTTLKPVDGLTLKLDGWYGALAESGAGADDVGFEIDGKASFKLLENLKVDAVVAYLIAGDATNEAAGNTDDVIEVGMRLSLSF